VPSAPFLAPGLSLAAIDAIYDELGPTPRLCFEKEISLDEYRVLLHRALDKLTLSYLEDLAFCNYLALDEVSHKLYMLRRLGMCVNSVEVEIATISPFVASKIAAWMRELQRHELVRFFSRSIASTSTRKMAGDTFEAYCHILFSTKIEFDYVPMVRIGGQPQTKPRLQGNLSGTQVTPNLRDRMILQRWKPCVLVLQPKRLLSA
jgi:hypothetical protein